MIYDARTIAKMSKDEIWSLPDTAMSIRFDDGVLETDARATIFSWYCMVFQRYHATMPIVKAHHIGPARLGSKTHLDLMGRGLFDAMDHCHEKGLAWDMEAATKLVYDTVQEIYNDFSYRLERYVTSISILDFVACVKHPKIKAANEAALPNQNSIDHTYATVKKVLMDPEELPGNPIAKAAKSGLVSMGQILQCISLRGYLTDINSYIFRQPILRGYVHGLTKLYDAMIESRSATKALSFAKDPVADSEYFNRRMQLGCATLRNIHWGDCGTTNTIEVKVTSSNFESLEGKYYLTDKGYKAVRASDRSLITQTIHMRSVLKCQHLDPLGVCTTCLGELAYSIPANTVLGHVSATSLCEAVSQNVLSTKHLDGSSTIDEFPLSDFDLQYLRLGSAGNLLKLSESLEGAKIIMTIAADQAPRLPDVNMVKSVANLPVERVSEIVEITLTVNKDGVEDTVIIPVSMGSRYSSLTHTALAHIKEVGWNLTTKGDYQIDFTGWDLEEVIFELPLKHVNMVEYMGTIEKFVKASPKENRSRGKRSSAATSRNYSTTEEALFAFYDLINSKLKVNIAHLEVILLSTMVRDAANRDHRLPVDRANSEVGYYEDNMWMRSLSATMAYERQGAVLADVRTYINKHRPDHPLDPLLLGAANQPEWTLNVPDIDRNPEVSARIASANNMI